MIFLLSLVLCVCVFPVTWRLLARCCWCRPSEVYPSSVQGQQLLWNRQQLACNSSIWTWRTEEREGRELNKDDDNTVEPDQTFHNDRTSRTGDQRQFRSSETKIPGFCDSKFVIRSVGRFVLAASCDIPFTRTGKQYCGATCRRLRPPSARRTLLHF